MSTGSDLLGGAELDLTCLAGLGPWCCWVPVDEALNLDRTVVSSGGSEPTPVA
jgi:hypothetical protein